jgi:hypothetical protein
MANVNYWQSTDSIIYNLNCNLLAIELKIDIAVASFNIYEYIIRYLASFSAF